MRLRIHVVLVLAFAATTGVLAAVKPLEPRDWPKTVEAAVPHILAVLTPSQRSIIKGTAKDNLFMHQGEWGEDIEELLGLNSGNTALVAAACGKPCKVDEATLKLMQAAWAALNQ